MHCCCRAGAAAWCAASAHLFLLALPPLTLFSARTPTTTTCHSTAALKFERAQAEADIGEAQAERNQLATLASRFKAALAKAGVKAKVEPLVVGDDAMVQRLWDSL